MPLHRGTVASVRALIDAGELTRVLTEQFRFAMGHRPSPAEVRSWERSLNPLIRDLNDAGLDDVEALVEYQLPLTSRRADVVLCGRHPKTSNPSYVVVELKQWSQAHLLEESDDVVVLEGERERLHPVAQVTGYCDYLADFIGGLDEHPEWLSGVAYLHNATDLGIDELWDYGQTDRSRLFTGQRRGEFVDYLRAKLAPESGADAADQLLSAAVRPSKELLSVAADEVQQRASFVLIDEQQTAYSLVMRAAERARRSATKEILVVSGGPGSGKSVIALSLLGELSRQGRSVLHATGSSAFTQTLRRVAGRRAPRVKQMFKYYNQFIDAEPNGLDALILDEAHRIKETSTNRYTPKSQRTGRPQVEELIEAARVPVFLLDEHQVVRPSERGTIAEIKAAAARMGCQVRQVDLNDQFRLGGSRVYEHWVLRLLGLEAGGPIPWEGDDGFEVRVEAGPSPMEQWLRERLLEGHSARLSAGYCWRWNNPLPEGELAEDVQIGDWRRPWNNPKDTSHGGAPGRPYWASDPAGFEQVGCVYTAQGFEYEYGGVIMGPDLVWRGDRWVARPEYSYDNQVRRGDSDAFDMAVRNTYKVLLTRGLRGAIVYSTDPETQELLESLVRSRAGTVTKSRQSSSDPA